jgi:DNA-binding GntR family transcriptional regulator
MAALQPQTGVSTSLRAQAYQSFQQQILEANIRPGQFISQRELMQLLGMPLGAVRELIPRLEAEGLLRTVPQRGLQIAHVDLKLINNAFQLRLLLEREAATRFCSTVSDTDLAAIRRAHERIVRRARSASIDDALLSDATTVDWGLHDLMIDALGNDLISEAYRINSLRVRLIKLENSMLSPDALLPAMDEHLWFIAALERRDAQEVARRLTHHIESAHHRVLGLPRPPLPHSSNSSDPPATPEN